MSWISHRWLNRLRRVLLPALALCLLSGQLALTQHELDHAPGVEAVCLHCANLGDRPMLVSDVHATHSSLLHEHPWVVAAEALAEPEAPIRRARAPPVLLG